MEQLEIQDRMLSIGTVLKRLGIPRHTFLYGVTCGRFPQPVRVSDRALAWRESDIQQLEDRLKSIAK
jgi:predicted DNA-binding transcriptional regulator AlpA